MERYKTGMLVKSLAGHDAGKVFVIIEKKGPYIYLADGLHRTVECPKKKKTMHVQLICRSYGCSKIDNAAVIKILKDYSNQKKGKQED